MNTLKKCFILLLIFQANQLFSQGELSTTEMKGYLSAMPSYYWQNLGDSSINMWQGLVHNRLNFHWYPNDKLTGSVQFRNQLITGDFVEEANYGGGFETESYFLPLSLYAPIGDKNLLYLSIDRLWLQYTNNNLDVKVGRQRINWGQTMVWNPNDIFNSYNFFDFDYAERPGADAVRIQYYTGMTSALDLAVKIDSANKVTAAGLYRFNKWEYDIQFMAGYYSQSLPVQGELRSDEDLVGGFGFSGHIKSISLRGEMSYFQPINNFSDTAGSVHMSVSLDYSWANETFANIEFLYTDLDRVGSGGNFIDFYSRPLTPKNLSFANYNFMGQVSYPVSPIFTTTLSGMYFFDQDIDGFFIGPYFDLWLTNDIELSLYFQLFGYKLPDPYSGEEKWFNSNFVFLRAKWSF